LPPRSAPVSAHVDRHLLAGVSASWGLARASRAMPAAAGFVARGQKLEQSYLAVVAARHRLRVRELPKVRSGAAV